MDFNGDDFAMKYMTRIGFLECENTEANGTDLRGESG